ncbi:hypothetical protein ZWY2020_007386 [Hordeum vulgare]|nr:hypothetical protein ZWY2020_007386 [Hordeum vulgare]
MAAMATALSTSRPAASPRIPSPRSPSPPAIFGGGRLLRASRPSPLHRRCRSRADEPRAVGAATLFGETSLLLGAIDIWEDHLADQVQYDADGNVKCEIVKAPLVQV